MFLSARVSISLWIFPSVSRGAHQFVIIQLERLISIIILPGCAHFFSLFVFHFKIEQNSRATLVTYAGYIVVIANALLQEPIADFPGEDRGTFPFVIGDFVDHRGCRHPRFAAADRPWLDRASLVIPAKEGGGEIVIYA